jgi:hypothetical protein
MENKANEKELIKDYAGGWITEREGTDAPPFLKIAFAVIGLGCTAYLFLFMNGEISHSDRGPLVQQFNQVTSTADGLMTMVGAMVLIYVAIVAIFAFKKPH